MITSAVTLFMLCSVTENAEAQYRNYTTLSTNPGDIAVGVGLTRGSSVGFLENSETGVTGQLLFTITEDFRGGIDFTYYLIGERKLDANELNANVHYFIRNRGNVALYGLGGINLSNTSGSDQIWRVEREIGSPDTRNFGLNAGVGIEFRISDLVFFGEPKLTLFGWNQVAFTGGVRYIL
ncbi:MAG: hypothetical protein ACQER4_03835 [Bacteroidota bacterium]